MSIIENIILICIFLSFPIFCYLIYIAYTNNMDLKEKNIFLEFSLISSLFLMIKYIDNKSLYSLLFYNIPLLLAFIKKKTYIAILISLIVIYCYNTYTDIPLILLIFEYFLYFLIYLKNKNKKILIDTVVIIKSLLISFLVFYNINKDAPTFINFSYISFTIITFIIFTYLSIFLFKKGEEIANLNGVITENKKQKLLYESLSKLTHELKNPITVCNGYLELIDKKGLSSAEKYLPIISEEINRSLLIINDFSSLGKTTSVNKEEVDFRLFLEEVIEIVTPLYSKNDSHISLSCKDELYILIDYNKMKQVFVNILKNSLEAKREDIPLEVKIDVKTFTNYLKICIKDNGTGMSKETLDRIYEVFYTTKSNGTGLGVVLSKEIIELHKGTIKYDSKLESGTKVTIMLPYK